MAQTIYQDKTSLTGGSATALDGIDGNSLVDGDRAYVLIPGTLTFYVYRLNATSGAAESSPNVIAPDTNPGNKRWILFSVMASSSVLVSTTQADNDSSTNIATTAFAKSQDAVLAREPDQGVNLTAAASGSSGITVLDNNNIDFGTGNFTLVWKGSLPDWAAVAALLFKDNYVALGWQVYVNSDGTLKFHARSAGVTYSSTVANTFVDKTVHEITVVIVNSTSVSFYTDGLLFGAAVAIASFEASSANVLEILGNTNATSRFAGTTHHAITYNRALTAAEELNRYRNGVAPQHRHASQTALTSGTLLAGQEYIIDTFVAGDNFSNIATVVSGTINTTGCIFVATGTTPTTWTNSSSLRASGATLILEPEGIQNGRWLDSSSNHLDATYPATGWSLTRPIPNQPVLQNLLTNSQWMAMSGSTLENVGSDLATNGSFASDVSWTKTDGTVMTITGGNLVFTNTPAGNGAYQTVGGLTIGKLYSIVATINSLSGTGITVFHGASAMSPLLTATATHTFEAVQTSADLWIQAQGTTTMSMASITLYEVTPGYVAADTLAPDGWDKDTATDIWRQHNDATYTKDGAFYSLKAYSSGGGDEVYWPPAATRTLAEHYTKFRGRTVTFGCWIYAAGATARLLINDSSGNSTVYHSAATGWEWVEITRTIATTTTLFRVSFRVDGVGATTYFSQPILVYGSSIGRGNYQPIVNEVIWLQTYKQLTFGFGTTPASGANSVNVESSSDGVVGKGAKAVLYKQRGANSAAGKYIYTYPTITSQGYLEMYSQVAAGTVSMDGFIGLSSAGDFVINANDANWSGYVGRILAIQT